ncbi:MAG: CoB--CoM heterodisulfide reductase iron-sulfur subunit A family protein [Acidobacteria bacterium]|nr:MAG: CoB--CoM heterodisulfide reductase iron-sulfur subunit A family protein [Acidobacteriota bacterium]
MNREAVRAKPAAALVVGGGIGGMRAALDLADAGLKAYLVEQTACLGGRVAQLGFMFPQHDCVLCRGTSDHGYGCTRPSISPAYIQHNQHPNIEILTYTRVVDVQGQAGDFTVSMRQEPRFVDPLRCTSCGLCSQVCPIDLPDSYQLGMSTRKAVFKVAARAIPDSYSVDKGPYCEGCGKCVQACPTNAIDLNQQPRLLNVEVGAIILALGFDLYDATRLEEFGYGRYPNVMSAMQYERLASRSGPTEGAIRRLSNGQPPRSIAWLQCIGSRDLQHSFCSSICCMYATKEAILAKQRLGEDIKCSIFLMDERAFNKEYSKYSANARERHGVEYQRCRVSAIQEDPETKDLILRFADISGHVKEERFEMVVLATGLQPPGTARHLSEVLDIELNPHGFCQTDKFAPLQTTRPGVFVCGAFSSPKEIVETVIDASGAAAEVMRFLNDRLHSHPYTRAWPFLGVDGYPPEKDIQDQAPRIGVFLCSCGGTIGKSIDLDEVRGKCSRLPGVSSTEVIDFACFREGVDHIERRIGEASLNRVVVAACSARTHEAVFQKTLLKAGLNPYLLETVNLREQCAQVHVDQPELATRKAAELIRTGVGRVAVAAPISREKSRCLPAALVIGGGVAGMTAALAIADSGYKVHLIERAERLGGNLLDLYYVAEGYNPQRLLRDLINRVRGHQNITTHTRAEVVGHSGHIGDFRTEVATRRPDGSAEKFAVRHGVIVLATGARETRDHPLLQLAGVITQRQLEEKIIHSPEEIAALRDVVMIQCVRQQGMAEYCSRVCCTNTIKNAIRLKLFNPACNVTILYKNIITYGFREEFYTEARRHGVVFVRYADDRPPRVLLEGKKLTVHVQDPTLERELVLKADIVPLSMAIAPPADTGELARMLRIPLSSEGFFQEAQLKLRPMDFMRDGIFLAGMAHYPKFLEESISHALAAAGRALSVLSQESLYLGGVVAQVDPAKCAGCLTCTRTCPFGIPQVIEQEGRLGVGGLGGAAFIDSALCQGCGTCTGECPANAIQLQNFADGQMMLSGIRGLGAWQ